MATKPNPNPTVTPTDTPTSLTLYDRSEGKAITVEAEVVRIARGCHEAIQSGIAQASFFLHVMQAGSYYRGLGCSSFKEYVDTETSIGYTTARRYARIGARLLPFADPDVVARALPPSVEVSYVGHSDDPHGHVDRLQQLGTNKLDAVLRGLDEDELEHYAQTGEIQMPGGGTTTFAELQEQATRKVVKDFRVQKKALQERAQVLTAERDKAIAERDAHAAKVETADELYETGKALERRFSPEATGLEQQRKTLHEAQTAYNDFRRLMGAAKITTESDEELRRLLWQVLKDASDLTERLNVEHQDVIALEIGLSR